MNVVFIRIRKYIILRNVEKVRLWPMHSNLLTFSCRVQMWRRGPYCHLSPMFLNEPEVMSPVFFNYTRHLNVHMTIHSFSTIFCPNQSPVIYVITTVGGVSPSFFFISPPVLPPPPPPTSHFFLILCLH